MPAFIIAPLQQLHKNKETHPSKNPASVISYFPILLLPSNSILSSFNLKTLFNPLNHQKWLKKSKLYQ